MLTTREDVFAALFARVSLAAAALPSATARRNPVKDTPQEQGDAVFLQRDGEEGEMLPAMTDTGPFYFFETVDIELIVSDTETALSGRYAAALSALDTALRADRTLAGRVKGLRWSGGNGVVEDIGSAAPVKIGVVTVDTEFESATRLAV